MAGNKATSLPIKIDRKVHLALKKYVIGKTTMTAFATAAILKAMGGKA